MIATSFWQDPDFIGVLYIISFAMFIYGLSGLTGRGLSKSTAGTRKRKGKGEKG